MLLSEEAIYLADDLHQVFWAFRIVTRKKCHPKVFGGQSGRNRPFGDPAPSIVALCLAPTIAPFRPGLFSTQSALLGVKNIDGN